MIALNFNPSSQWFEPTERECVCGKRATGILRSIRNETIVHRPRCKRCADRDIKAARAHREKGGKP